MATRMLALVALAEFLGMTLWFSATAATPALVAEFHLTTAETAWLTMAVQAGFVAGTLASALLNLPDVLNARLLFALGCLAGALANAGVAWIREPAEAIVLRFVTGAALACVYPPGMKIAAGWFERRRGTALGVVVGALTIGSAFPHLLAWMAATVPWRTLMVAASALASLGGLLMWSVVRDGPYVAASAPFDPRAAARVFTERGTRLATLGYLGHMWELYAMWTWIAAFATASYESRGLAEATRTGSLVAFVTIGSGALGCVAAGFAADRVGQARIARAAMIASGLCAAVAGLAYTAPPVLFYAFALVWGVTVVADSAQFSALVAEHSPRDHVGTALTVQTCAGFLLTMVTIRLLPWAATLAGWQWAFIVLVPGPALGALAMGPLVGRGLSTVDRP